MLYLLPETWRQWLAALGLGSGVMLVWAVGSDAVFGPARPLLVTGSTVARDGRELRVRSGERVVTSACPAVLITRWVEVASGPPVYVEAEVLDGPLGAAGPKLPPRREVAVAPGKVAASDLRLRLPEYLRPEEALALVVRVSVPDDKPCANGFTGAYDLYRLSLP